MKTELLGRKKASFRYLKEKDIDNPHYQVVCFFCCDENHLEALRFGMIDLMKTACSDKYYGNKDSYYYNQQQFVKLMELAYVLYAIQDDLKLSNNHPLYRFAEHPTEVYTKSRNRVFPELHFRSLYGTEVNNIQVYFEQFFGYKSLEDWRGILDSLLYCATGKVTLAEIYNSKLYETVLIREYIEKMIEAMGLVCETKSLPYVKLHHNEDFKIKEEEIVRPINTSPLSKFKEKNLPAVIEFIANVIEPEKIYCLNHRNDEDGRDHADLVLVLPEKYPQTFEEVETVVKFAFLKHLHLSCTLFKSSFFHKMVGEGHIYFSLACNSESLFYDDKSKPLPALKLDSGSERIEKARQDFYTGLEKAKTFYAAAETYRVGITILSAFMLHQAAELCLRALIRSLSAQDKSTHSLKLLLKQSLRLTTKLSLLMLGGSAEDERLLHLFDGAYLGYRYQDKYDIESRDLNILFERVKNLHAIAEETFVNWVDRYERH